MTETQTQTAGAPHTPGAPTHTTTAVDEQFKLFVDIETLGLPRPGMSAPGMRRISHEYPVLSASFILWSLHRGVLWDSGEVLFDDLLSHRGELRIDPVADQMHRANGLLRRVRGASHEFWGQMLAEGGDEEDPDLAPTETVETAMVFSTVEDRVLEAIDELAGPGAQILLAGKSPGALDVPVLQLHMPGLAGRLGHRTHDVSVLEREAKLVGVDLERIVEAEGQVYDHTANSDNRYTVALYEAHLQHVLGIDLAGLREVAAS